MRVTCQSSSTIDILIIHDEADTISAVAIFADASDIFSVFCFVTKLHNVAVDIPPIRVQQTTPRTFFTFRNDVGSYNQTLTFLHSTADNAYDTLITHIKTIYKRDLPHKRIKLTNDPQISMTPILLQKRNVRNTRLE